MSTPPALSVHDLTVRFGGLKAVDSVTFDVPHGRLVGIIGPNGAGKTTFIDAVSGLVRSTGRIELLGRDVTGTPAHRRRSQGLGRTFQSLELFEDLTVLENVLCAADEATWWSPVAHLVHSRPSATAAVAAEEALALMGLEDVAQCRPTDLSLGRRKLVTIARAWAGRPQVLVLDEPAAGLDSEESQELGRDLRRLVDSGLSIVMVEHDMALVHEVCDELKVLEFGRLIAEGSPAEVSADPRVAEAYLGSVTLGEAS